MNELIRCKDCGRPISKDEQENFLSLCYECHRRFKKKELEKSKFGFCSKCCIVLIILLFVSFAIIYIANNI